MSTAAALVTVEEYEKLPEPASGYYELRHGEVVYMTAPKRGHKRAQERIRELLKSGVLPGFVIETEMAFRPAAEHEVWVADVGAVSVSRDEATADDAYLEGAPDLVVEVLSPSNTADEIADRMAICLENGCRSFWVVNTKRRTVDVTEGDITRRFKARESVVSGALSLSVAGFF